MAMPYARIYGLGYIRYTTDAGTILDTNYDSEAIDLFEKISKGVVGQSDWVFTRQAIGCAKRLFGEDTQEWFDTQAANEYLTPNARAFLNDTIKYINTGVRPVSLQSWVRILTREQTIKLPKGPGKIDVIADIGTHPITQWLRHDLGLIDLVTTLNILFGYGVTQ